MGLISAKQKVRRVIRLFLGVVKHPAEVEKFLKFNYPVSEAEQSLSIGSLAGSHGRQLVNLVKASGDKDGPIVEIGSLFGHSAQLIVEAKDPNRQLICVDAYQWNPYGLSSRRHKELLEFNLAYFCKFHSVKVVSVKSNDEFFSRYSGPSPSLVFIDAGHFYEDVRLDIAWALQVGASVICGDDYNFPGVRKAVDEVAGYSVVSPEGKFWYLQLRE